MDAAYLVAAAVSAPWWLRKKRSGWRERFGRIEPVEGNGRRRLLVHAVSVGEVNLVRPLVSLLSAEYDVVVSATTDTGIARAREVFGGVARVVRYPLDASWAVRRFLDAVRPEAVCLVELELWPNFARACAARGVPVAVVNGRLSDRSFGRYRLARPALGKWFGGLAFVAAQDEVYARRFEAVGVPRERVHVAGTMKWDAATIRGGAAGAEELAAEMGIDRSRPLIVAGSTAPEEHALLHAATPAGVQLLCAPRKPEWFDGAAKDLPGCVRRSRRERRAGADRFLLDTIGELRKAYALADVAVVGRSFGGLYGSDPMEPAALGKPVVIGPAVDDFRATVEALLEDGAIVQTTREGLAGELARLLADQGLRRAMGERAVEAVRRRQGATQRHAELIRAMLPARREAAAMAGAAP